MTANHNLLRSTLNGFFHHGLGYRRDQVLPLLRGTKTLHRNNTNGQSPVLRTCHRGYGYGKLRPNERRQVATDMRLRSGSQYQAWPRIIRWHIQLRRLRVFGVAPMRKTGTDCWKTSRTGQKVESLSSACELSRPTCTAVVRLHIHGHKQMTLNLSRRC
jgi:hypothetical protein